MRDNGLDSLWLRNIPTGSDTQVVAPSPEPIVSLSFFPDGNYPASALITVSHFARPGMLIEIQGVAVIGG